MNFGGAEVVNDYTGAGIVIVPVPYDDTSTWMRGSDKGPEAIMEASVNLEFYDIETKTEVHKRGIHTADPLTGNRSPEDLVHAVYKKIKSLLSEDKFPVIAGGNHTVSIGAVKAFTGHFSNLSVLQLDAHTDLRNEYEGSALNHACTMSRILEMVPAVQVGIRSMSADELPFANEERIFYSHRLYYNKALLPLTLTSLTRR
jgi:agmatinase